MFLLLKKIFLKTDWKKFFLRIHTDNVLWRLLWANVRPYPIFGIAMVENETHCFKNYIKFKRLWNEIGLWFLFHKIIVRKFNFDPLFVLTEKWELKMLRHIVSCISGHFTAKYNAFFRTAIYWILSCDAANWFLFVQFINHFKSRSCFLHGIVWLCVV